MKTVYFVRHGETAGNKTKKYQQWDIPLSDHGRAQARFVAERFKSIPFDVIIASDMERAAETGRIIADATGHTVETSALFRELAQPTEIRGKSHTDPAVLEIKKITASYWLDTDKRYSDEENFLDLKKRALDALTYLVNRPEERIVVATHGTILRTLMACLIIGESLDTYVWEAMESRLGIQNTAITWCEHDGKEWRLITWNDHAHLG